MDPQDAIDFSREAITTCIVVGGPILAISLIVGLLVSVLQAMTQLHDQSISFVPKILLLLVAIAAGLPWLSGKMIEFTKYSLEKPVVFQPVFEKPINTVENADQRVVSLEDPEFQFEWAKPKLESSATSSSMPILRSANARLQPQLNPDPKLQPRRSAPFALPAFRQATVIDSDREARDEF